MVRQAGLEPPLRLTSRLGRRSVRLTDEGLLWQQEPETVRIPFGAIGRAYAMPGSGMHWDFVIEPLNVPQGRPASYRIGGPSAKVQAFADAVGARRLAPADPAVPDYQPYAAPRWGWFQRWHRLVLLLLACCAAQFLLLALTGHPLAALATPFAVPLWWTSVATGLNARWQWRFWRQEAALAEPATAHYLDAYSSTFRTTDARARSTSTHHVLNFRYTVTDQLGHEQQHSCSATSVKYDRAVPRPVLVVPGRIFADAYAGHGTRLAGQLVVTAAVAGMSFVPGVIAFLLVPGLLLDR